MNSLSLHLCYIYDTVDENTAEVPQSGSSPAVFIHTSVTEVPEINSEPVFLFTENVAYTVSSHSSRVDLEAQQPHEGAGSLVQNVAYKPTTVLLSSNVAYESHDQGTELNQDEYDYI